ncbi:hypothetical protein GGI35DRAFT_480618 [Trichoderma velutinum]
MRINTAVISPGRLRDLYDDKHRKRTEESLNTNSTRLILDLRYDEHSGSSGHPFPRHSGPLSLAYPGTSSPEQEDPAADADALRKACRVVDGTITIPLSLSELENISLDGIEVINGDLRSYKCGSISIKRRSATNSSAVSFSSSTLTTIHGDLALDGCIPDFTNISFPNLKTIDGAFDLVNSAALAYLDITNLDSVGYFRLNAPTLVTMVHKELRNVTGAHGTKKVVIEETSLTSVDSVFRNPLDIGDSPASIEGKTLMFENYPTQAVNYTNFNFELYDCTNLNLSSQFTTAADGTTRQIWYWPQKNIKSLWIEGNVSTPFL